MFSSLQSSDVGDTAAARPTNDPFRDWKAGTLGMTLLLVTLGVLFAAGLAAYVIILLTKARVPPPAGFVLPWTIWLSTVLILISSGTLQYALSAIRGGSQSGLRTGLLLTTVLAVGFLISQIASWYQLRGIEVTAQQRFYVVSFWFLVVLHGLHVLGGIIPMLMTTSAAFKGVYRADYHPGVAYTTMYWHFLDVVWLILLGVLWLTAAAKP